MCLILFIKKGNGTEEGSPSRDADGCDRDGRAPQKNCKDSVIVAGGGRSFFLAQHITGAAHGMEELVLEAASIFFAQPPHIDITILVPGSK